MSKKQLFMLRMSKNFKNKFASSEKGRIFAPAFDKRGEAPGRRREKLETDETRDSVCHDTPAQGGQDV